MKLLELKGGCLIGLAGLAWLYASYFMGLHTDGFGKIWLMAGIGSVISLVAYSLALGAVVKAEPETSFIEGLKSGAIMAVIAAVIAVFTRLGYFEWINPNWTEYMMAQMRLHFEAAEQSPEVVKEQVELASVNFSRRNDVMQAGLGALVSGFVYSALVMGVIRYLKNR